MNSRPTDPFITKVIVDGTIDGLSIHELGTSTRVVGSSLREEKDSF